MKVVVPAIPRRWVGGGGGGVGVGGGGCSSYNMTGA